MIKDAVRRNFWVSLTVLAGKDHVWGGARAGQAWNHVDIASKAMAALFRLRPNRVLCAGGVCATKHLKETKAFDHFWPSKVMPCRGERRKG
ncbi:hypothetical protein [Sphingobacterium griseoflavum]|uniref:hypothetical protein n=1 Tax=Sphingobacterium griseoflavum TaxID=1474952 RepID=UPI001674F299|nr:hypothetical protein [Sphingobacterium griseoflavum]